MKRKRVHYGKPHPYAVSLADYFRGPPGVKGLVPAGSIQEDAVLTGPGLRTKVRACSENRQARGAAI